MLPSVSISGQPLSPGYLWAALLLRVHSVRAGPREVCLSLLDVQAFPRVFGYESGTSLCVPQILGDTAGVPELERNILPSLMGTDGHAQLLSLSVGVSILCVSELLLCNNQP